MAHERAGMADAPDCRPDLVLVRGRLEDRAGTTSRPLELEVVDRVLSCVRAGTHVAFVGFHDRAGGCERRLMRVDEETRERVVQEICAANLEQAGWTRWADALRSVVDVLNPPGAALPIDPPARPAAVLLVTGAATADGDVDWAREPEREACQVLLDWGWPVFAVGAAGAGAPASLLKFVAERTHGDWRLAA